MKYVIKYLKEYRLRMEFGLIIKIIGTMNLSINGMTYGLPEPLVDRCEEMKQFKLTVDDLLNAI